MFQGTELNLVSRLKSAFYELQFAYDAIDVLTRNKILLERLAKLAENRYSAGQATQQDLIKSQIEISLIETRLLEFERSKQSMIAEINSLLNRDVGAGSWAGRSRRATFPRFPRWNPCRNRPWIHPRCFAPSAQPLTAGSLVSNCPGATITRTLK